MLPDPVRRALALAAAQPVGQPAPEAIVMETWTPEKDITETLPDGRVIIVAAAGVPVPRALAVERGWLRERQQPRPQETKAEPESPPRKRERER